MDQFKNLPDDAKETAEPWLRGLTPVAEYKPQPTMYITVAKDAEGKYHVITLFSKVFVPGWNLSCDAQAVDADTAFSRLEYRLKP